MKNLNLSIVLGCCIISIGIIIAGVCISNELPSELISNFSGTLTSVDPHIEEFMSEYEVANYLKIDLDVLEKLVESDVLGKTFIEIDGNKLFSRDKLSDWIINQMH